MIAPTMLAMKMKVSSSPMSAWNLSAENHQVATPAASVSGFYLSHPEATYFNVGPIGQDQLDDLAQRRGQAAQQWLPSSGIGGLVAS